MGPAQSMTGVLEEQQQQQELTCQHYWVIDTPAGPVSKGVCRQCGEERLFQNYLGSHPWEQDELVVPAVGNADPDPP